MSVSYDLTYEEITGFETFSFWKLFKLWIGLDSGSRGSVRVDVDQPFSVKEFVQTWKRKNESDTNHETFLLNHLKWNVGRLHRFSSLELLSFLIAFKFVERNVVRLSELEESFEALRMDLLERKKGDFNFSGKSNDALRHALALVEPHFQVICFKN